MIKPEKYSFQNSGVKTRVPAVTIPTCIVVEVLGNRVRVNTEQR